MQVLGVILFMGGFVLIGIGTYIGTELRFVAIGFGIVVMVGGWQLIKAVGKLKELEEQNAALVHERHEREILAGLRMPNDFT